MTGFVFVFFIPEEIFEKIHCQKAFGVGSPSAPVTGLSFFVLGDIITQISCKSHLETHYRIKFFLAQCLHLSLKQNET